MRFQLAGLGIFASLLMTISPVFARQYQPPTGEPPDSSVSNGSRPANCDSASTIPLTILAPLKHVGQSSTLAPTFIWFVPAKDPYRLNLSVFTLNPDSTAQLLHELEYVETVSGINRYTLPLDKSELQFGQRYFLQVSLTCQPNQPRYDQSFITQFETQAPSASLRQQLSQAQTSQAKLDLYAESGYWYDALREALTEASTSKQNQSIIKLLGDMAESEGAGHRDTLQKIVESL